MSCEWKLNAKEELEGSALRGANTGSSHKHSFTHAQSLFLSSSHPPTHPLTSYHARTHARMHARTHARTHARMHAQVYRIEQDWFFDHGAFADPADQQGGSFDVFGPGVGDQLDPNFVGNPFNTNNDAKDGVPRLTVGCGGVVEFWVDINPAHSQFEKKQQALEKGIDILGFADVLAAEFIGKYDCGEDKAGRKILRDLAEAAEANITAQLDAARLEQLALCQTCQVCINQTTITSTLSSTTTTTTTSVTSTTTTDPDDTTTTLTSTTTTITGTVTNTTTTTTTTTQFINGVLASCGQVVLNNFEACAPFLPIFSNASSCEDLFDPQIEEPDFQAFEEEDVRKDKNIMELIAATVTGTCVWLGAICYRRNTEAQRAKINLAKRKTQQAGRDRRQLGNVHDTEKEVRARLQKLIISSMSMVETLAYNFTTRAQGMAHGLPSIGDLQACYNAVRGYRLEVLSLHEVVTTILKEEELKSEGGLVFKTELENAAVKPLIALERIDEVLGRLIEDPKKKGNDGKLIDIANNDIPNVVDLFPKRIRGGLASGNDNDDYQNTVRDRLSWPLEGEKVAELEMRTSRHVALAANRVGVDLVDDSSSCKSRMQSIANALGWRRWRKHPLFYGILFIMFGLVWSQFVIEGINGSGKIGGLFDTFLGIPPQYATECVAQVDSNNDGFNDRTGDPFNTFFKAKILAPGNSIPVGEQFPEGKKEVRDGPNGDPIDVFVTQQCVEQLLIDETQKRMLPFLYGVMHMVLMAFNFLPIFMARGFQRDIGKLMPKASYKWYGIPVDDFEVLHRFFGYVAVGGIVVGAIIWLVMMGISCQKDLDVQFEAFKNGTEVIDNELIGTVFGLEGNRTAFIDKAAILGACKAFNPTLFDAQRLTRDLRDAKVPQFAGRVMSERLLFSSIGPGPPRGNNVNNQRDENAVNYFDPRDNVLFLRILVWYTWMFLIPLILFAYTAPPSFLPKFIKRWWYEWCYFLHIIVAWTSIVLALYARFEVFFPSVVGWGLLLLNYIREYMVNTYSVNIVVDANAKRNRMPTKIYVDSRTQQPTAVSLSIAKPKGFVPGSGQWCYIKVPDIDSIWHPFSLASCSLDNKIELHIGIRGEWDDASKRIPGKPWEMKDEDATWTYKLLKTVRELSATSERDRGGKQLNAMVKGPYGSAFARCATDVYPTAVVVGAGTGLTSALSVLKEILKRRALGKPAPDFVWFVWACKNEQDLEWCWRALQDAIFEAWKSDALKLGQDWSPLTSNMLDWLSINIYVTRTKGNHLSDFLGQDHMMAAAEDVYRDPNASWRQRDEKRSASEEVTLEIPTEGGGVHRLDTTMPAPAGETYSSPLEQSNYGDEEPMSDGEDDFYFDGSATNPPRNVDADDWSNVETAFGSNAPRGRLGTGTAGFTYVNPIARRNPKPRPSAAREDEEESMYADAGVRTHPNFKSLFNPGSGSAFLSASAQSGSSTDGNIGARSGDYDWMVGVMSRKEAEEHVLGKPNVETGNFCVRVSASGGSSADINAPPYVLTTLLSTVTLMFQHDKLDVNPATGLYEVNGTELTADCRTLKEVIHHCSRTRNAVPVLLKGAGFGRNEHRPKPKNSGGGGGAVSGNRIGQGAGVANPSAGASDALMATLLKSGLDPATAQVMVDAKAKSEKAKNDEELLKTLLKGGMAETAARAMISAKAASEAGKTKDDELLKTLIGTGIDEVTARKMVDAANKDNAAKGSAAACADDGEAEVVLDERTRKRKNAQMARKIRVWLEEQVISASMDEKAAPVKRLLQWVKKTTLDTVDPKARNAALALVSVCFCGPPGLGAMLADTVSDLGPDFEFASHMQ